MIKSMRFCLAAAVLCLPLAVCAANNKTVEYHLKNGLTLLVQPDHRAPVVFSSVWYKVGGAYEHDGITGISHILEHMMFRGTKQYGPGEFAKLISDVGGKQNAMTSADFTVYFQSLSADQLPLSFKLEADRMHNLLLKPAVFAKERNVVMSERRMRVDDNPQGLTWERFNAAAYVNNPYHHPVVGWMTDIQHITVGDLKRWYDEWYAPNNATVIVVGDVQPKAVLALAKKDFAHLKPSVITPPKPRTEVASLGERQIVVHTPAKLPWLVMGYNVPSLTTAKQAWKAYALDVLSGILSAGDSSRLPSQLVRGQQIAAGASASYDLYSKYQTLFVLDAFPAVKHSIAQLKQALLQQIRLLQSKPVTQAELDRVKAQIVAQNVFSKDSLQAQAMDLGVPMMSGLPWQTSEQFVSRINAITPAQIQAVAKEYLQNKRLTAAVLQPSKENRS